MQIVKCDKCGKVANKAYYNAGMCETLNNTPYTITLREGTCYEGEQLVEKRETINWELCEDCFEKLKEVIRKF